MRIQFIFDTIEHEMLPHFHFLIIQTHCGLKLWEGSCTGSSIAIHVWAAGGTVQMLPAGVTFSEPTSRGNPGGREFSCLSWIGDICHEIMAWN